MGLLKKTITGTIDSSKKSLSSIEQLPVEEVMMNPKNPTILANAIECSDEIIEQLDGWNFPENADIKKKMLYIRDTLKVLQLPLTTKEIADEYDQHLDAINAQIRQVHRQNETPLGTLQEIKDTKKNSDSTVKSKTYKKPTLTVVK